MPEIEAPIVGTEIDPTKPGESARNVVMGVFGVVAALFIFAAGNMLFNAAAGETDAVDEVEVL